MMEQSPPAQLREELMVRLRAEAQLGGNIVLPELQRHLELHQNNLKLYQNIYAKDLLEVSLLTVLYTFIK